MPTRGWRGQEKAKQYYELQTSDNLVIQFFHAFLCEEKSFRIQTCQISDQGRPRYAKQAINNKTYLKRIFDKELKNLQRIFDKELKNLQRIFDKE